MQMCAACTDCIRRRTIANLDFGESTLSSNSDQTLGLVLVAAVELLISPQESVASHKKQLESLGVLEDIYLIGTPAPFRRIGLYVSLGHPSPSSHPCTVFLAYLYKGNSYMSASIVCFVASDARTLFEVLLGCDRTVISHVLFFLASYFHLV
jgi:hypothetical protein